MTIDPAPGLIVPQMIVIKRASWCENNVKLREKKRALYCVLYCFFFLSTAVLIALSLILED